MAGLFKGFKNFLLRGDVIVIVIGLIVALALSTLVRSFTSNIINPIISRVGGKGKIGLGFQLGAPNKFEHIPQHRGVHIGRALLRNIHGRHIFFPGGALQTDVGAPRSGGVRRGAPGQDLPRMPLRRPSRRGPQVQALRK